jgi:hypothetical protein
MDWTLLYSRDFPPYNGRDFAKILIVFDILLGRVSSPPLLTGFGLRVSSYP